MVKPKWYNQKKAPVKMVYFAQINENLAPIIKLTNDFWAGASTILVNNASSRFDNSYFYPVSVQVLHCTFLEIVSVSFTWPCKRRLQRIKTQVVNINFLCNFIQCKQKIAVYCPIFKKLCGKRDCENNCNNYNFETERFVLTMSEDSV